MTNEITNEKNILRLSVPLFILLACVSALGLFTNNFYYRETTNWATQGIAQDMVDLFFISPILLIASILAYKRNLIAKLIWGGTNLFVIYTFALYCFAVHFNVLFIPYCIVFGLSIYSFIYFLYITIASTQKSFPIKDSWRKATAVFLILIAGVFYLLWLSEIIPANINNTIPKSIAGTGVLTNPVHVIDLAVCLPGIFIIAVLLLKKKIAGLLLTPPVLVFCIEMSLSIAALMVVMKQRNELADLSPLYFMGIIALIGLGFLIVILRNFKTQTSAHYKIIS